MQQLYVVLLTVLVPMDDGTLDHRHDVISVLTSFEQCLLVARANKAEVPPQEIVSGEVNISCIPLGDTP